MIKPGEQLIKFSSYTTLKKPLPTSTENFKYM